MNPYLYFLEDYRALISKIELSPHGEHILGAIALYNANNLESIRCADLIVMRHLGSPATIHKNYIALVLRGYLKHRRDKDDKRIKYIELTEKGRNLFIKINDLLVKCKKY